MDFGKDLTEIGQFRQALKRMELDWVGGSGPEGMQLVCIGTMHFEFDREGRFQAMVTTAQPTRRVHKRGEPASDFLNRDW